MDRPGISQEDRSWGLWGWGGGHEPEPEPPHLALLQAGMGASMGFRLTRLLPWGMGPKEGPDGRLRDLSPTGRTAAISPAPALTTLAKREDKQSSPVSGAF